MEFTIARRHSALYWCNEIIRSRFSQPEPLIGPYDLAAPSGPQWQQIVKDLQVCEFPLPIDVLVDRQDKKRDTPQAKTSQINHIPSEGSLSQLDGTLAVCNPEFSFLQAAASLDDKGFEGLIRLIDYGFELCGLYKPTVSRSWEQIDELFGAVRKTRKNPAYGVQSSDARLDGFEELCWESSYYGSVYYRNPVTTTDKLRTFLRPALGADGTRLARKASAFILNHSASPMETQLAMILSLPFRYGGAGFPMPMLNHRIYLDAQAQQAAGMPYLVVDICWPEHRLVIEYDGGAHGPSKETEDARRRSILASMGYTTLSVRKGQINGVDIETLIRAVALSLNDNRRTLNKTPDRRNELLGLLKLLRTPIEPASDNKFA